jgi:hypothetical protein
MTNQQPTEGTDMTNLTSIKEAAQILGVTYASMMHEINSSGAYQGRYIVEVGSRYFLPTDWVLYLKERQS